ncbi:hypothetical protein EMIT0P171_10621 [Pseudomonas sp. IT-P171]
MGPAQGRNDHLRVISTLNSVVVFTLLSDNPSKQRTPGMARVLLNGSEIKENLILLDLQESS